MCFEPPSLASIDFVRVALLFFQLIRQLQPRLWTGKHTAPIDKQRTPHQYTGGPSILTAGLRKI